MVDMPEKELRRLLGPEIAMVFQDSGAALCPIRTVGDQIYESMREHERISRKECAERAVRMMAKIGLKDGERVLQSYPFELSGGMNQRVGCLLYTSGRDSGCRTALWTAASFFFRRNASALCAGYCTGL